ncbi:hypothetical protein [Brevundimonas sp. LjRoot202]|uniref:hypothetical protein n=1 Tax=Brevundimonas sp. LjRoot202 TaxID=3342281 RepID=UPI003ECEA5B0
MRDPPRLKKGALGNDVEVMTFVDLIPLGILSGLVGAAFVQRSASRAVQRSRLVLAEKGERFLARIDVPAGLRADVERKLANPFPCNCSLMFVVLPLLPFLVWIDLGTGKNDERFDELRHAGHEVRGAYLEIRALTRKIGLASHPIMSPIAELIVSLSIVMAVPFLLLSKRFDESALDRDSASEGVDEYWSHLPKFVRTT